MGLGVIKKSIHKHLKIGGNAKVACRGEGVQRVSPSLHPLKLACTSSSRLTKYGPVLIFNSEEIM